MNEYVIYRRKPIDCEADYTTEVFRDDDLSKAMFALEQLVANLPKKADVNWDVYYSLEIEEKGSV